MVHTSFRSVSDVDESGGVAWAATSGGVFSYDSGSGEIVRYTPLEGLHNVSPVSISVDSKRGSVWIGYSDGVLDLLDVASGQVSSFRDIERASQFSNRGINEIVVQGDSVFVATNFGVVVFDPVLNEVRDSYTNLGAFSAATPVHDILLAPTPDGQIGLWLGTDEGLAFASLSNPNLKDPLAWSTEGGVGFPVLTLEQYQSNVFLGTENDLYRRTSPDVFQPLGLTNGIKDCVATSALLYCLDEFRIIGIDPALNFRGWRVSTNSRPTSLVVSSRLWIADSDEGLVITAIPDFTSSDLAIEAKIVPSGPFDNGITDLAIGKEGDLWLGGTAVAGSGFYHFKADGSWEAYTSRTVPDLVGKTRFRRVHVDAEGNTWAGSEGGGLVRVSPTAEVTAFDESNSSLRSAAGAPGFIIVGGVDSDSNGNLWVSTRGSSNGLHVRTADGAWTALPPYVGSGLTTASTAYDRVVVDSFDQLWIIVRDETSFNVTRGLLVVDTNGTPTDATDDSFQFFRTRGGGGVGLPSVNVRAIAEDRGGLVWIGTSEGPAYFVNTGAIARDDNATPIWPQRIDGAQAEFLYLGLPISSLMIDPANQIWIGTDDGIRVVAQQETGFVEVASISTDNDPLLDNGIISMVIRPESGRVFIATDQGLQSVTGLAIESVDGASELFVFPNPVVISQEVDQEIFIEGLADDSELRVVDVSGSLVARFDTRGGRYLWNGRDSEGQLVDSGIYVIIAVSKAGEPTVVGKVAIIR